MTPPQAVEFAPDEPGVCSHNSGSEPAALGPGCAGLPARRVVRVGGAPHPIQSPWLIGSGALDYLESDEIVVERRSRAGIAVRRIERRPPLSRCQFFIIGFSLSIWGPVGPRRGRSVHPSESTPDRGIRRVRVSPFTAYYPARWGKPPSCCWGALPVRSCGCLRRL